MNPIPEFNKRVHHLKSIRAELLSLSEQHGTPLYVFDRKEARENFHSFRQAFEDNGCPVEVFYAIKSNPYPGLLRTVVENGGYLDASSPSELTLAQKAKAKRILYTGPAKSRADLEYLVSLRKQVFLHLDSLHELEILGEILKTSATPYECGVRIYGSAQANWSKFGLPLGQLKDFLQVARRYPNIAISALQFHMSFNRDASRYKRTIKEVGAFLRSSEGFQLRKSLKVLDIGGGYAPAAFEGVYPWNRSMEIFLLLG